MANKACAAPKCKLCGTNHWSNQPHDKAGLKATAKAK